MKGLMFVLLVCSLWACSDSAPETKTKEEVISEFKAYEDSLFKAQNNMPGKNGMKSQMDYAERCLSMAHQFPKDKDAAKYMDKAHMTFAAMGLYGRSAVIADSIITYYPLYKNRAMVLESAASTYDMFIVPRDKAKVKKYYEMLLKENPKMPKEQRESLEFRLKNIDLTYQEMIGLQESDQ